MKKMLLILSCTILLVSCIFEPDKENFSFKLSVKDSAGNPVEGLNVSLMNKIGPGIDKWDGSNSRASTAIRALVNQDSKLEIKIKNINNNTVCNLYSEDVDSGSYTIIWHGKDNDENDLPSGLYYCQMRAEQDGDTFYKEKHSMYLQSTSSSHKNGTTDESGVFQTTNKKPFINLFKTDSLRIVDMDGYEQEKEAFSDTTIICLYQGSSSQFIQMEYVKVKDKENEFEITWDPENRVKEVQVQNNLNLHEPLSGQIRDSPGDIIPSEDAKLVGSYPNPFN